MSMSALLWIVLGTVGVLGLPIAINILLERRTRDKWAKLETLRAERARKCVATRKSPEPLPAVKRPRQATPVGARR